MTDDEALFGLIVADTHAFHECGLTPPNFLLSTGNILYHNPAQAYLHRCWWHIIEQLPEGYNTLVGPHGIKLSGGERQRLAVARAALRNPRILILDEATSNLDNVTVARVQRALERLMDGRTTLAISHRWTTLRHCDPIYCVLDNGQVAPVGSYEELLELAERFGDHLYTKLTEMYSTPVARS